MDYHALQPYTGAAGMVLLLMLLAHALGDFVFQTQRHVLGKQAFKFQAFARHCGHHALLTYLLVGDWRMWTLPLAVFTVHGVIDALKAAVTGWLRKRNALSPERALLAFSIDQLAHLTSLWLLWRIHVNPTLQSKPIWMFHQQDAYWNDWSLEQMSLVAVCLIGAVIAVRAGSFVIAILVAPFERAINQVGLQEGDRPEDRGFDSGGKWIGQLERLLIFLLVMMHSIGAVGLLVAAKSIFRFGEMRDRRNRMEAEYILLGTLLSFAWGLAAAWLTQLAMPRIAAIVSGVL